MPKVRTRARYSIVIINESGHSRQIDLTPLRMRIGIGAIAGIVGLVLVLGIVAAGSLSGKSKVAKRDEGSIERLKALQEELSKKELALTVLEKRLKEMQEPTLAAVMPKPSPEPVGPPPLSALQESSELDSRAAGASAGIEEEFDVAQRSATPEADSQRTAKSEPVERRKTGAAEVPSKLPPINFNAEAVTASAEASSAGTLSFRLIKDQPAVQFAGFLFVFLEMVDQRGETKIYAYPERTRLGDGDLPGNYKDGKDLTFKYNCRIELPFNDIRPGARLDRVSILLYGENGKIVFQRGFDRNEVKVVTAKSGTPEGTRTRAADKRRPL